ncbi:MAG: polyamine aminopropyltransferase, partial [Myxococcota bacterium]
MIAAPHRAGAPPAAALLVTVFVIGTCGLVYELLAGTLASYVLGDSVMQFSTVIGVYLFAMGIGAWLSGFLRRDIAARFVEVEIAVALIGGSSAAVLFLAFARLAWFQLVLYGFVLVIGVLVGLEIPLLMRILQDRYELKDLVSRVLTFDYLGALLASLAFPLLLVPKLGLVRGGFLVGILNVAVGLWCTHLLKDAFARPRTALFLRIQGLITLALLAAGFLASESLTRLAEDQLYADPIVFAERTPYQRIVLTRSRRGFNLYLDGHLQFTSQDEHRYHEALVHPAFASHAGPIRKVLVLGGGDGLAVREVLRYSEVEQVMLVDLDPAITRLAAEHPLFVAQNQGALTRPEVEVTNADAMVWLHQRFEAEAEARATGAAPSPGFDLVVVDFPDPNNFALGKLYTTRFYRLVRTALAPGGRLVVQSTS